MDGSLARLVEKGLLTKEEGRTGWGSDQDIATDEPYTYTEYFIHEEGRAVPLVDYSYLYDENGNPLLDETTGRPIGDRWDYWSERDFISLNESFNILEDIDFASPDVVQGG